MHRPPHRPGPATGGRGSSLGGRSSGDRRRHLLRSGYRLPVAGVAEEMPNWNTVHRQHLQWSKDGTWERIAHRLAELVREREARDGEPSAGIVDARSVRSTSNVTGPTRGYDAGKKISGRKAFGVVDTLGLLVAVAVAAASDSDNVGGIAVFERARTRSSRFAKLRCDAGFKKAFLTHVRSHHVKTEVVTRVHDGPFEVLPRRWVVERTWSWLANSRQLQVDYERHPEVHEGLVWAAHSRYFLRRLTQCDLG